MILVFAMQVLPAVTSRVVLASSVVNRTQTNPAVIVNIQTADLSARVETGLETTTITDLNLSENGSITFSLMTSAEVYISNGTVKSGLDIEIVAEGFHRYDYDSSNSSTRTYNDEKYLVEKNAVPLDSMTPEIDIPQFYGSDENCAVKHSGSGNRIEVEFSQGVTRADLTLATFTVSWKGAEKLDPGVYKAMVSVIYSTP
ncbi:MAG: hypothetical protein J5775_06155 [Spirochaetales bacterium]|nr:hypothetical protein [Spirochaetales bacterium]